MQKSTSYASTTINEMVRTNLKQAKQRTTTNSQQCKQPQSILIEIRKDWHNDDNIQYSCDDGEKFPSFDLAVFSAPQKYYIEVMVLPEHPTSAIGYRQLLQSMNHLPILILITCLWILAYFCMYVAIANIAPERGILFGLSRSFILLGILVSTETLVVTFCCRDMILEALYDAYDLHDDDKKTDHYLKFKTEDDTLYSMPSSFGGIGVGGNVVIPTSTASLSWKHSSPNLCSMQMKHHHQQLEPVPATQLSNMGDFRLSN
jgi:hypothetical protein